MNHPDTFFLLNKLGLVHQSAAEEFAGDGKAKAKGATTTANAAVLDPPHEVIHKLMNLTLQCLGAVRNLIIEEQAVHIERNCCDLDPETRNTFDHKSKALVRETFGHAVKLMAESIIFAKEIKDEASVYKTLVESFPWEQSVNDSSWCMPHFATYFLFDKENSNDEEKSYAGGSDEEGKDEDQGDLLSQSQKSRPLSLEDTKNNEPDPARIDHFRKINYVLDLYPNSKDELDRFGQTLMAYAISSNSMTLVQLLAEKYPDLIRVRDGVGKSAIHYCARYLNGNSLNILQFIMALYSRPETLIETSVDDFGNLPLHEAAHNCVSVEIVSELLFLHPDAARIPNCDGKLPLHLAMQNKNLDVVQLILNTYPMAISAVDNKGWMPMHHAAYNSTNPEVIKFLHKNMPQAISTPHVLTGRLPIHYACINCQSVQVLSTIIELYPEGPAAYDLHRRIPLHYLIARTEYMSPRRIRCMMVLMEAYQEGVYFSDKDVKTPYDIAKRKKLGHYILFLLLHGYPALDKPRFNIYTDFMSGELTNTLEKEIYVLEQENAYQEQLRAASLDADKKVFDAQKAEEEKAAAEKKRQEKMQSADYDSSDDENNKGSTKGSIKGRDDVD